MGKEVAGRVLACEGNGKQDAHVAVAVECVDSEEQRVELLR